jgi:hypothetical protein
LVCIIIEFTRKPIDLLSKVHECIVGSILTTFRRMILGSASHYSTLLQSPGWQFSGHSHPGPF